MTTKTEATTKPDPKPKKIHIFVNRNKIQTTKREVTGAELLQLADFDGTGWDLLALEGETDPSGGVLIMADTTIKLKNGAHFRVIPGDRTFGALAPLD